VTMTNQAMSSADGRPCDRAGARMGSLPPGKRQPDYLQTERSGFGGCPAEGRAQRRMIPRS
jgi:hypothetical protein